MIFAIKTYPLVKMCQHILRQIGPKHIFPYLSYEDLMNASLISQNFHQYIWMTYINNLDVKHVKTKYVRIHKNTTGIYIGGNNWTNEKLSMELSELRITSSPKLTDEAFTRLNTLKKLIIENCEQFSDNIFTYLVNLEYLQLDGNCVKFTNNIFKNMKHLKKLYLYNCNQFTDDCFKSLNTVQVLCIDNCENIKGSFLNYLPNIRELILHPPINEDPQSSILAEELHLNNLNNLKKLDISACLHVSDEVFQSFPSLVSLNISNCTLFVDEIFEFLPHLKSLDISNCIQFSDKIFDNLRNLTSLDISYCEQFSDKIFDNLRNLKKLNMRKCPQFSDKILNVLKNITSLDASYCPQLSINK